MKPNDDYGTGRVQLSEIAEEIELTVRKDKNSSNQRILANYANQYALDQRQIDKEYQESVKNFLDEVEDELN